MSPGLRRWVRRFVVVLGALTLCLAVLHRVLIAKTGMVAPAVTLPVEEVTTDPTDSDLRLLGDSYAKHRGKILEVSLTGSPEVLGSRQVRLLRPEMLINEGQLWRELDHKVPSALARMLLFDIARLRFRYLDEAIAPSHRAEIAAGALAFAPDPWDDRVPTFQRMVYLQSLYDVSLSFEHSPLIGCTSFVLTGEDAEDGHTLLARAFDFEAGDVFDEGKAVFLVREAGKIPYASVAWPGLIGAVSGINAEGLALVVHGARAKKPVPEGEPVLHTLRDVLASARDTEEAVRVLASRHAMVSHLVLLADAHGDVAIVERAPGEKDFVRRGNGRVPLTNHFEGPFAGDPANLRVRADTSTLARRTRLDERLAALGKGAGVADAVSILRDRAGPNGETLALGDRRAIDALIATHGVVIDATARVLWVSEGPHLLGRFVRFDLARLLAPGYDPHTDPTAHDVVALPADPLLAINPRRAAP